jgi:hypothetical protein
LRNPIRQCLPFHQLHHDELLAVGLFETVNGCDVRVIQRGEELGFPFKAGGPFWISAEGFREDFDGDLAIEPGVDRSIYLPHPPGAKQ